LGLFVQGLLYWNLGNSQIYTPYGSAGARFEPFGSGYEIQFGMQQAVTGPWNISGSIGFLQQDFKSETAWTKIVRYSPPAGKAAWGSSAIQATLNLWYYFGAGSDTAGIKSGAQRYPTGQGAPLDPNAPPAVNPAAPPLGGSQPQGTAPPEAPANSTGPIPGITPADSTRRF
nr:hypothetical protein [Fibrobacterota bacterium]